MATGCIRADAAGRRLAKRGLSVLFVEKGPLRHRSEGQEMAYEMPDHVARQSRGYDPPGSKRGSMAAGRSSSTARMARV